MKTKALIESSNGNIEFVTQRQMDLIVICMDKFRCVKDIENMLNTKQLHFYGSLLDLVKIGYITKTENGYKSNPKNYIVASTAEVRLLRKKSTYEIQKTIYEKPIKIPELPSVEIQQQILALSGKMNRSDVAKKLKLKKAVVLWTLEFLKGVKK